MTDAAPLRDRVAFVLLVPSLAVPIVAIAIAAWRMGHLDDARLEHHPGIGLSYFAAMMTLSAALFSMAINAVLAVRNHASISTRAIPLGRVSLHFGVTCVVMAWVVFFCAVRMEMEGLVFGTVLVVGSMLSFAVVSGGRVVQRRVEVIALGLRAKRLLQVYPIAVAIATALGIFGLLTHSELHILWVALLGFLGLPWSGFSALFWLPVAAFFGSGGPTALPWIFLVLAAIPAAANAIVVIVLLRSSRRRTDFVNDFLEARSFGESAHNSLGE